MGQCIVLDAIGRWSRWGGGDSYFTYPDPTDPDVIYYEHQFGELRRKQMSTGEAPGTNRLEIVGQRGRVVVEGGKIVFTPWTTYSASAPW